ncbi:hypothetical protein NM688_g8747 [Phlebia brevispora]|uniref:Uncharacterized protein n=1 Tax=Phlebia brevispora TaxID=194682 RepID=A0ACC1RNE6_9APHY|nr:hypothetical protein NM688_g8747 [Phlebia brevispora]
MSSASKSLPEDKLLRLAAWVLAKQASKRKPPAKKPQPRYIDPLKMHIHPPFIPQLPMPIGTSVEGQVYVPFISVFGDHPTKGTSLTSESTRANLQPSTMNFASSSPATAGHAGHATPPNNQGTRQSAVSNMPVPPAEFKHPLALPHSVRPSAAATTTSPALRLPSKSAPVRGEILVPKSIIPSPDASLAHSPRKTPPIIVISSSSDDSDEAPDEIDDASGSEYTPSEYPSSPRLSRLTERNVYKNARAAIARKSSSSTPRTTVHSPHTLAPRTPLKSRARRGSSSSATSSSSSSRAPSHNSVSPRNTQCHPSSLASAPSSGTCPLETCQKVFSQARDFKRHIHTHIILHRVRWQCCGIPVTEAAQYGICDVGEDDIRYYEITGDRQMVGGCGIQFSRKDVYSRHLRDAGKECVGDPNGSWIPDALKGERRERSAEPANNAN